MEFLAFNPPTFATAHSWLGFAFVSLSLTFAPPGKAQMLMNLAPQAIPNSTTSPTYTNTLNAAKQGLTIPKTGAIPSQPPGASLPDAAPQSTPPPQAAVLLEAGCELKVAQMNDIERHKVVRVHSGRCLMVFNAND